MLVLSSIELPNVDDDHVEHVKHLEPQTLAFITTTTTTTIQNQNQNNHQLLGEGTLFIGEDRYMFLLNFLLFFRMKLFPLSDKGVYDDDGARVLPLLFLFVCMVLG